MIDDSILPLCCKTSPCTVEPLLHAILDEMKAIHQTLKCKETKVENPSKVPHHRPQVNRLVFALQVEFPEKVWTADSFAEKIGCTGAAVRKTKAWREYRERLQNERQKRPQRKGYKTKKGNLEAFEIEKGNDFENKT